MTTEHMARNKSNMNVNEQQIKNTTSDNNKKPCEFPEARWRLAFHLQESEQINKKVEHKKTTFGASLGRVKVSDMLWICLA